jgi:hypothetical protein
MVQGGGRVDNKRHAEGLSLGLDFMGVRVETVSVWRVLAKRSDICNISLSQCC